MATQISGSLISREYSGFRGVDFSNRKDEIALNRSPDALNMWKNYKSNNGKCIETRPDIELLEEYSDTIFGFFFYTVNGTVHKIVHSGEKLYDEGKALYLTHNTGNMSSMADTYMAQNKSNHFIMNNILYILDGKNYLRYDGETLSPVEGAIPRTLIGGSPSGGGTKFQDVNFLSPYRKNEFCSDGVSKDYMLNEESIDADYQVRVWVDDKEMLTGFTVYPESAKVTFTVAPKEPDTPGADNVVIQFKKEVEGYRETIENCTIIEKFDNRVFFSGNPKYPNFVWYCEADTPGYIGDGSRLLEGTNDTKIKSLVAGNNALWGMKEPGQNNTTIFYHVPGEDADGEKYYAMSHSNISTGCETLGINFNDTICFFSDRGMEAISGDVTTEQVITHVSSLVDNRLLNEEKYKDMILQEWEGYLLVIVGNRIYLADSRALVTVNGSKEFEWFYWEFDNEITSTLVKDGVLYLCTKDKVKENGVEVIKNRIYTLTKKDTNISSYWCTKADEFNYPQYQKTTNKKGCVADIEGEEITVAVRTDNNTMEEINTYTNVKGYVVPRIKKKKWKSIQLQFSSNKPFNLYSTTLEAYVGSYVKR